MGCEEKVSWVNSLCRTHKISFLALQETRLKSVNDFIVKKIWGDFNFDYAVTNARGRSGGILSVWDKNLFSKKEALCGEGFVDFMGVWSPTNAPCCIINIYAPQQEVKKRILWTSLLQITNNWNGVLILARDFNTIRNPSEKIGSFIDLEAIRRFNEFISNAGVIEMPSIGRRFT